MERSVSVEDFLGGLLRLGKTGNTSLAKMNGLGQRTDSEAAFQVRCGEFARPERCDVLACFVGVRCVLTASAEPGRDAFHAA
jgi:hypothetical protein